MCQGWQEISSTKLEDIPVSYATDFQGNLYLGFSDGRLTRYGPDGKLLENFSLSNNSAITLIDVQNNLRPFLFYFDNQQITILDRFSSVPKEYQLLDFNLEIGMMTCPAPDGDFWVVENNPQRLKKINPLRKVTVLEVQISLGDTIKWMQAFQNILVVGNENGLHILDQFGGLINTMNIEKLKNFQITGGKLYCFTESKIYEIDPFNGDILSTTEKPEIGMIMLKSLAGFLAINKKRIVYYSK